jgi:dienelactone hydrolase
LINMHFDSENIDDSKDRQWGSDIPVLADRVARAVDWLSANPCTHALRIGLFGASTGAAVVLMAAAWKPDLVATIVSRGGRPDLAGEVLDKVHCPTLLIVGGDDGQVVALNAEALERLPAPEKNLVVVPGASHLFEEAGKLEEVARLAVDWFLTHLAANKRKEPV